MDKFDKFLQPFPTTMLSLLPNFRESLSDTGAAYFQLIISFCSTALVGFFFLLAASLPVFWIFASSNKKKKNKKEKESPVIEFFDAVGDPSEPSSYSSDPLIIEDYDLKYSLELQMEEVLFASFAPDTSNASSLIQERILLQTELIETENVVDLQSKGFCEICLDDKESWQMFKNDTCDHSFCYECTSKHIVAKIEENLKTIRCPGANCMATLDSEACRWMIPENVLARWDDFLCLSSIPESQKLFCPFRDCSAMLIDDSGVVISEIKCPVCHRSFCAKCRVPWHPDFSCKEFQKLNSVKTGKEESMFKSLVKKKNWQKCPCCKIHVEKNEGCVHITCRCGFEFCYRCGTKWSSSHICKKS